MKSFKDYMKEETMPFAGTAEGFVGIDDPAVRDNLNGLLAVVTSEKFITPYIGLERVAKVLANYHIFIPKHSFLEGDSGMLTFPVNQFGGKIGMQNDGEVVTAPVSDYHIFFEYRMSDCGMFKIFCEVVDEEELDEILADIEAEVNDDTEEDEDEINEAALAGAETGPRKTPGSSEGAYNEEDNDESKEEDDDDEAGLVVAEERLDEVSKKTLASYIKKASHDVATKSAATGRYADRANRVSDEMKKGDYSNYKQGKKDDAFAEKMFKKSWKRRKGIEKAVDKMAEK